MKKWFIIWSLAALFVGCSEEKFHASILDTEEESMSELDRWVTDSFRIPHNIEVIYHWDDFESDPAYVLVPPSEEKVEPFLRVIRKMWINPYTELAGLDFFNTYCPKQIMLVGSAGYNTDGTYTMGQTETGSKITIYNLNMDTPTDKNAMLSYTHTFHHEFAHVFHQTEELPEAYELVTANAYTSSWATISRNDAVNKYGCITSYAMCDADEDFAEMVAYFLITEPKEWEKIVDNQFNEGCKKIKQKETIMLNYMKSVWGIDMYRLREKVKRGMDDILLGNY